MNENKSTSTALKALAVMTVVSVLAGCSGQALVNGLTPSGDYTLSSDISYGDKSRQNLDVYVPKEKAAKAPVVVFFYGGRWEEGNKDGYKFVGQALSSRGFVTVIPNYRLYPQVKFPAFVQDGAKAVAWARAHATEYGADPDKLVVMGHSAGGQIAALLALDGEYLQAVGGSRTWLAGMVGLAGPYDFLPLKEADLQDMFGPPSHYPASQPINFVDGKNPPLLLLHGLADKTVYPKNARNLAKAVAAKGGQVAIKLYPGVTHIRLIANLAAPIRFFGLGGTELDDISAFIDQVTGTTDSDPQSQRQQK